MGKDSAARKLLKDFRSLMQFAEAVEELGKVETALADTERRRREAEQALDRLKHDAHKEQQKAEAAKAEAEEAASERARIISQAQADAKQIVSDARKEAERIKSAAQDASDRLRAGFKAEQEQHEQWVSRAKTERHELESKLGELRQEIARIRERVA